MMKQKKKATLRSNISCWGTPLSLASAQSDNNFGHASHIHAQEERPSPSHTIREMCGGQRKKPSLYNLLGSVGVSSVVVILLWYLRPRLNRLSPF